MEYQKETFIITLGIIDSHQSREKLHAHLEDTAAERIAEES